MNRIGNFLGLICCAAVFAAGGAMAQTNGTANCAKPKAVTYIMKDAKRIVLASPESGGDPQQVSAADLLQVKLACNSNAMGQLLVDVPGHGRLWIARNVFSSVQEMSGPISPSPNRGDTGSGSSRGFSEQ